MTEPEGTHTVEHPTTYVDTLMHILKANIGTGIFAMGDAVKNSGAALGPPLIAFLGFICVYSEHLLLNTSTTLKEQLNLDKAPDFATSVELCFSTGPERIQKYSLCMRRFVNVLLVFTHLGFCCVYIVFVASTFELILKHHGHDYDIHLLMVVVIFPIILCCMIRNLKYLAPISAFANLLLFIGAVSCIYYSVEDLSPHPNVKLVARPRQLPLFFGTALFAFEGIGVVIPLKSDMKNPSLFDAPLGVLNVGKTIVTISYVVVGILAYLKYGDSIRGSVTLSIPQDEMLAQVVKWATGAAILFTYPIQYYVPFQVLWPSINEHYGPFKSLVWELAFRLALVLLTFVLAEAIPYLNLFISLVGAFSGTALQLLIPPALEYVMAWKRSKVTAWVIAKALFLFIIGILGAITGTYESIAAIVEEIRYPSNITARADAVEWLVF